MQVLRGVVAAVIVVVPLTTFFVLSMHATIPFAALTAVLMGVAITIVVGTRRGEAEAAEDTAWQREAPDLPPASDRRSMEAAQSALPGPEGSRLGGTRAPRRVAR
jgi:hypothetical protein